MNRIEKAQILLEQSEKDLKRIRQIIEELKKIEENRIALDEYYTKHYMEDYEQYSSSLRVLDQDSVWNVLNEQYQEKKILLKNIVKSI